MGIEFIRKAAPSFHKGLDRSRIALGTPKLFTVRPDCAPRSYAATQLEGASLCVGDHVGVFLEGFNVLAVSGMTPVAVFNKPSAEFIDSLRESFGVAAGKVQEVHNLSGIVEIAVC
jgi:hypothetical protein